MNPKESDFVIDVGDQDELVFWARSLGIDVRTLVRAVMTVGPSLDKVTQFLDNRAAYGTAA
jgi:hypothetical protein